MHRLILFVFLCLFSCKNRDGDIQDPISKSDRDVASHTIGKEESTISERIKPPLGFSRSMVDTSSFGHYLRTLPLKPTDAKVTYYDGRKKSDAGIYCAVVNMPIGDKDLHQCADAIMRLKAEYHWRRGEYDKICFNFTNGFRVHYTEWMKGRRMIVDGNKTYWNDRNNPSNTYADFWNYMELIFMYAGTASLEKELTTVDGEPKIGDVLIQGGFPGHAVIIVDRAQRADGKSVYLLAQSYMPAQELQVLINPTDSSRSPWYELNVDKIVTPEWSFKRSDLRRFGS